MFDDRYMVSLLLKVIELLETKQTAKQKHCGIGYGGL
jgi:hypothetical protein